MDSILTHTHYLAGPSPSAADIIQNPFIQCLLRAAARKDAQPLNLRLQPFDRNYPQIAAWLKRMKTLPGYDNTYPPRRRNEPPRR